jgi:preprotein translocase subunit YajC
LNFHTFFKLHCTQYIKQFPFTFFFFLEQKKKKEKKKKQQQKKTMQKGKQSNYKHSIRLIILKIDHAIAIGAR